MSNARSIVCGGRCFVVAGGPSLQEDDLSVLASEPVVAVNRSYEALLSSYVYLMDHRLLVWICSGEFGKDSMKKFLSKDCERIMPSPMSNTNPRNPVVKYIPRGLKAVVPDQGRGSVFVGNNSGFGAIQFAVWMGAKEIFLLGFDMHAEKGTHFHGGYKDTVKEAYSQRLREFKRGLEVFAPQYASVGVKVVNLSPGSALTCFPQMRLRDVI